MLSAVTRRAVTAVRPQTRNLNVVTGPALVHVSTGEKIIHGAVMGVSWLAIPAWVLYNMKFYKAPKA